MTSPRIGAIRRSELQKAAYEVACKYGLDAITVEQIARHGGVSKGIVHHYFRSKQHLLEHAIRYGESLDRKAVMEAMKKARAPSQRLWSIIDNYWPADSFNAGQIRFWLSVMDADLHNKRLAEIGARRDNWICSKLALSLRHLVAPPEIEATALTIFYLMEGSWILAATQRESTRKIALEAVAEYLRDNIPHFDKRVVKQPD
jgi:TetR/AcrR family transcriptional regulator, transcriptional repressor of bet genes